MTRHHQRADHLLPSCNLSLIQVPAWIRFNPYVLESYRPMLTVRQCARSIFCVHNETGNIWSHLIGCLILAGHCVAAARESHFSLSLAGFSGALNLFCSVLYHAFMPCCRTEQQYRALLNVDVTTVATNMAGSTLVVFNYGYRCLDPQLQHFLIAVFYSATLLLCFVNLFSKNVHRRAVCFVLFLLLRAGLVFYVECSKGFATGMWRGAWLHFMSYVTVLLGGFLNTSRIPEKWFPGRFDLWGNSHQLMHLLTLGSMLIAFAAGKQAMEDWRETPC
eukprot:TRINITY_DN24261_c0_g1_i2.p1 TRINITY_DN24261_c0_g1~~TRINITY_DN24261_c0_g1_i2.p1  ORF type:complete len:285 (+),score=27.88 TRINITY_DN24261_c0_g1_i2:29-856(+)